jgi:hypothetical protein
MHIGTWVLILDAQLRLNESLSNGHGLSSNQEDIE